MKRFSIEDQYTPILHVIRRAMPFLNLDHGPWVAGGSGRLIFEGETKIGYSDIDVFFPSQEMMTWGAGMISRHTKGLGSKNRETFNMDHAAPTIELTDDDQTYTIQIIGKVFRPTIDDLITSFDYNATVFITDGYEMVSLDDAIPKDRILRINNENRIGNVARLAKYSSKGFYPAPGLLSRTFGNAKKFTISDSLQEIPIINAAQSQDYNDIP